MAEDGGEAGDGSGAVAEDPSPECRLRSRPPLSSHFRLPVGARTLSSSSGRRRVAVGMRLRCAWAAPTERRERVRAATGVVGERDMFGENKSVALAPSFAGRLGDVGDEEGAEERGGDGAGLSAH